MHTILSLQDGRNNVCASYVTLRAWQDWCSGWRRQETWAGAGWLVLHNRLWSAGAGWRVSVDKWTQLPGGCGKCGKEGDV